MKTQSRRLVPTTTPASTRLTLPAVVPDTASAPANLTHHGHHFGNVTVGQAPGEAAAPNQTAPIPSIQRLAVAEQPVDASNPPLVDIKELTGGHKGVLYLLENQAAQKLVAKFQNEAPTEAVAGTDIMQEAGAITPAVRQANAADLDAMQGGLQPLKASHAKDVEGFAAARAKFGVYLVMEFAEGKTIMKVMDETPRKLIAAFRDPTFQAGLGRVMAADAFAGNPDRMFAGMIGFSQDLEGWYHEQNLFIHETAAGAYQAVAIDNAFAPWMPTKMVMPYGRYMGGAAFQVGSVAAAHPNLYRVEAGLVFDRVMLEMETRYQGDPAILAEVASVRTERATIVQGMVAGAEGAMQRLLRPGRNWMGRLATHGATANQAQDFRQRNRYLRILADGVDPKRARMIASNERSYRLWVAGRRQKDLHAYAQNAPDDPALGYEFSGQ